MNYTRNIRSGGFAAVFDRIEESDAEKVIVGVEAHIRSSGRTHRELAELAGVDVAAFTLFMQRHWPANWPILAESIDDVLAKQADRHARESRMPVETPVVREVLGMVKLLKEDGGIGLLQGDSGTGKTEAVNAVALRHDRVIVVQASTARARMKPMLEDIGHRMGITYCRRETADTYQHVRERLPAFDLLVVDEVHKYIGKPDCLNTLADLLKETRTPQLWTATGDLLRYLDKKTGHWADPFAQIRSRISHKVDLSAVHQAAFIRAEDVREIAARKFDLKLDADAARELCELARLDNEGSIRLVENTLKHARRFVTAGKLAVVTGDIVRRAMDRTLSKRTRERTRAVTQAKSTVTQAKPTPARSIEQEARRATA